MEMIGRSGGGLNAGLLGGPGSRDRLATPALVLDLEAVQVNLAALQTYAEAQGLRLRPHAKTHKSVEVARRQIAAGAVGQCCATVGEAEVFGAAGLTGLLITSPPGTPDKLARVVDLHRRTGAVAVTVDTEAALAILAGALAPGDAPVPVVVDLDVGQARTGCVTPEAALALCRTIDALPQLHFAGVQAYAGHRQHVYPLEERRRALAETMAPLAELVARLREDGLEPPMVTGGGTGSFALDAEMGLLTELQCGSYCFMDSDYGAVEPHPGAPRFEPALWVAASVINANRAAEGFVTIDAGLKALAADSGTPRVLQGADPETLYRFTGDEHGRLTPPKGAALPAVGDRIELLTSHVDPTVNLYDVYHVVRGDTLVDLWPIDARGAV